MNFVLLASFASTMFGVLLTLMAVFLILLVLVQRGRGGGLAGALGGMGGSSAFGAKAGDVFTRITIVAAAVWIALCISAAKWGSSGRSRLNVTSRSSVGDVLSPGKADAAAQDANAGKAPADKAGAAAAPAEPAPPAEAPADAAPPAAESAAAEPAAPPAKSE